MRRTTRFLATATALWTVLGVGGPAAAGGWWSGIPLQGAELGVGERFMTDRGEILFDTVEASARARQGLDRYYAYLIPDLDWSVVDEAMSVGEPGDWWVRPETRIRVGEVEVRGGPSNLARIRVAFDVPEVEPGTHALMLCTAGCVRALADVVPHEVLVTEDPLAARTARELSRLGVRLDATRSRLGHRVAELERELRVARSQETDPDALDAATTRVVELERRVAELEGSAPGAAWLVVGAAGAALLLLPLRRRRPREGPPTPPRVVEMELAAPPQELEPESEPERTPVPAA